MLLSGLIYSGTEWSGEGIEHYIGVKEKNHEWILIICKGFWNCTEVIQRKGFEKTKNRLLEVQYAWPRECVSINSTTTLLYWFEHTSAHIPQGNYIFSIIPRCASETKGAHCDYIT